MAVPKILCPRCRTAIPGPKAKAPPRGTGSGASARCPACGLDVDLVEVPDIACRHCGGKAPLLPGRDAGKCGACGAWTAREPGRAVLAQATCPRCRRTIDVPLDGDTATCPHCAATLRLADSF